METSQQSPTQSNGDRSYDRYDEFFRPSSPLQKPEDDEDHSSAKPTQAGTHEENTLCEDDPGAVNFFDAVGGTAKTVSTIHEESSIAGFVSLERSQNMAARNPFPPPFAQFPETPAPPPQNPFRLGRSQLLPTSQLFHATQYSSGVKLASPTSSRPSPDDFQHNSISPNPLAAVSSPLKARGLRSTPAYAPTSSPQILPGTTSTGPGDGPSSPLGATSTKSPVIPDSQSSRPQRKRSAPQPMASYEPMRKSQERRSTSEVPSASVGLGEDDQDGGGSITRRMKAKFRKEAAFSRLPVINNPRPAKLDHVEVPSTTKGKRRNQDVNYLGLCDGSKSQAESEAEDEVADSQENLAKPAQSTILPDQESTQSEADEHSEGETESIPDTAPGLPVAPRSPPLVATPLVVTPLVATQRADVDDRPSGDAIPETSPVALRQEIDEGRRPSSSDLPSAIAETKPATSFLSSPPALSTRSRRAHTASNSTSSLSNLASTPSISSSTTPATRASSTVKKKDAATLAISDSSPVPTGEKRRGAASRLTKLKTGSKESAKVSARSGRRLSNSTDELSRSATTTPTFEPSIRQSRVSLSKSGRIASKNQLVQRGPKIFEGMAFAISFQSKRHGETNDQYNTRVEFASTIEKKIKQAGGRVLEAGFDELFDISPVKKATDNPSSSAQGEAEINLTEAGRSTGFTALIADGHSRKVKYMQALALGLPCLAGRWVTCCLERGEIVDWTPYLLCAGQSTFLGDAIRSRNLTPYDASTARLAAVINQRAKLLSGSRILLVMKKALEGKKMAYVFLARILGASVSRVYSTEEARVEVKAEEDAGTPFDWVYVDGKDDAGDLFATPGAKGGGKKRKRASAAASTAAMGTEPPLKKIRTLSDELVIQSLILGRLIEEGEMEE